MPDAHSAHASESSIASTPPSAAAKHAIKHATKHTPKHVLMLGWEFPPYITGGLGTACYGITQALTQDGHHITFVLPKPVHTHPADLTVTPVSVVSPHPNSSQDASGITRTCSLSASIAAQIKAHFDPNTGAFVLDQDAETSSTTDALSSQTAPAVPHPGFAGFEFQTTPTSLYSPYAKQTQQTAASPSRTHLTQNQTASARDTSDASPDAPIGFLEQGPAGQYFGDMLLEAQRYASYAAQIALSAIKRGETFDVIHAHDWMTFPAGMAIAAQLGIPLILHVHSTEYDRSGEDIDPRIADIERRAGHAATKIIAVSQYTRSVLTKRYGLDAAKTHVIYNGITCDDATTKGNADTTAGSYTTPTNSNPASLQAQTLKPPTVLFFGRVTQQKGPEYFLQAAKRVLEHVPDARFVIAGSGDQTRPLVDLAAQEGIGHRVFFTGFLSGADIDRAFAMADVYVMPSVSEPFGIAALEAIRADVPVIISKQSGVSEVIQHALKVDFWDTTAMAEKIIAVLKHHALAQHLKEHAAEELQHLTWEKAALQIDGLYTQAIEAWSSC